MLEVAELCLAAGRLQLQGVSLRLARGEFGVLMGPTGSGKTSLLECLCGLRPAEAGAVVIAGRDVTALPPRERNIGYVPQDGALFSTHTVREHLAFALHVRRRSAGEIDQRCRELASLLDLTALLDRRPAGLSGGERQRVALGRALAVRPAVLLLDEPLSAIDEPRRDEMCDVLRRAVRETAATVLHVTHSRREAAALADRTFQLAGGRVVELETAAENAGLASAGESFT